jgi:hypothetical protein
MSWHPITSGELQQLIDAELATWSADEVARFERIRVPLRSVPLRRFGNVEYVFIVAEHEGTVVYFEDVEEGFNLSKLSPDGFIASRGCEQWELRHALNNLLG